jgi:hypothetical protein
MTYEEIKDAFDPWVRSERQWLAGQPDAKRVTVEMTDGSRYRVSRRKMEIKPAGDKKWHDLSAHFSEVS